MIDDSGLEQEVCMYEDDFATSRPRDSSVLSSVTSPPYPTSLFLYDGCACFNHTIYSHVESESLLLV